MSTGQLPPNVKTFLARHYEYKTHEWFRIDKLLGDEKSLKEDGDFENFCRNETSGSNPDKIKQLASIEQTIWDKFLHDYWESIYDEERQRHEKSLINLRDDHDYWENVHGEEWQRLQQFLENIPHIVRRNEELTHNEHFASMDLAELKAEFEAWQHQKTLSKG
jgi:hypothetical protein